MAHRIIKRTLFEETPLDNPGGRVAGMEYRVGEMFSKIYCYFFVVSEGFGIKCDRLIGRGFSTFAIEGFDYAPQT